MFIDSKWVDTRSQWNTFGLFIDVRRDSSGWISNRGKWLFS